MTKQLLTLVFTLVVFSEMKAQNVSVPMDYLLMDNSKLMEMSQVLSVYNQVLANRIVDFINQNPQLNEHDRVYVRKILALRKRTSSLVDLFSSAETELSQRSGIMTRDSIAQNKALMDNTIPEQYLLSSGSTKGAANILLDSVYSYASFAYATFQRRSLLSYYGEDNVSYIDYQNQRVYGDRLHAMFARRPAIVCLNSLEVWKLDILKEETRMLEFIAVFLNMED